MSFDKLNRYRGVVKAAVQRKPSPLEEVSSLNSTPGPAIDGQSNDSSFPQKQGRTILNKNSEVKVNPLEDDPFSEPDTEKNIIILDKSEMNKALGTDATESDSEVPQIKAASLVKLVERVTYEKYADPNFQNDFLYTYRSFTSPRELLQLLIKRFNMPVPKGLAYGELQEWKQSKQKPIRLRVINVLKNWIEKYWKDFAQEPEMGNKLHEFLMEDLRNSDLLGPAEHLTKLYQKKREEPFQEREVIFSETPPKPILPTAKKPTKSETLGLMDFNSEEIARQMTLIEDNLYKSIKPWEFFGQAWTKKDKETNSPNILAMIQRFNKVSGWVTTEIVKAENLKMRIQVLTKFIEIAEKCRAYNNYNAVMEIYSGLQATSVYRLRQTWNGLSSRLQGVFEELKDLMARQGNFSKLRKHLKTCNPPIIPYLGYYLTDLLFIEDGNPDFFEGGLINWVKRRRLATVLKEIQQYQLKPYCLEPVPFIQEHLLKYIPLDEDGCYKLSLMREVKVAEKEPKRKSFFFGKDKSAASGSASPTSSPPAQNKGNLSGSQATADENEEEEEDFEIEYKAGYKFYDKDSDHNIIFEKDKNSEQDIILAGTLPKLVERLTYEKYPDTAFLNAFLKTFRTFVTPAELLDLLIMRYQIPPPVNATPDLLERFKQKKEMPIQLRVLNALKMWADKHFEDFREDKQLLTKMLEFVETSMIQGNPMMSRAGNNFKAQILTKLEATTEARQYQFDKEPPTPIIPAVPNPGLLDYSPEELARQFTLMDFDMINQIKPNEYLHLNKSSASYFSEEQQEEDPETVRMSPHIVAVMYRFTDVRDWVATEVIKAEDKLSRAKVIEQLISIAQHCLTLKNFQTLQEIITGLNFDFITKLKGSWLNVSPAAFASFLQLTELVSYKDNFKNLRQKLSTIDYPCIPYLGMYLQELASIKEQLPDTIEPGSFINFQKRQKIAGLVTEIYLYQQQPYCLEAVQSIQDYLRRLDIYEIAEMKVLSTQYQETDQDVNIAVTIYDKTFPSLLLNKGLVKRGSMTPPETSPRSSLGVVEVHPNGAVARSASNTNINTGSSGGNSPKENSPRNSLGPEQRAPPPVMPRRSVGPITAGDQDVEKVKPMVVGLLSSDLEFRKEVIAMLENLKEQQDTRNIIDVLNREFPNSQITDWKVTDNQGTVFGWSEDINAKVIQAGNDLYIAPVVEGCEEVDKATLAVFLRIAQMYESINRFTISTRPKVVIANVRVSETAKNIATRCGVKII